MRRENVTLCGGGARRVWVDVNREACWESSTNVLCNLERTVEPLWPTQSVTRNGLGFFTFWGTYWKVCTSFSM